MSVTLRVVLIVCSFIAFFLCIARVKQSKLKIANSIVWMIGSIILILMSIFSNAVLWIANKLGFEAASNCVFFILITFLLIQSFINNMNITELSEKIKELNHYIALKEKEENKGEKNGDKS